MLRAMPLAVADMTNSRREMLTVPRLLLANRPQASIISNEKETFSFSIIPQDLIGRRLNTAIALKDG
jgi:hypothetical protein